MTECLQSNMVWWKGTKESYGVQVVICYFYRGVSQDKGTETRRAVLMGCVGWQGWQLGFRDHRNQTRAPPRVSS